MGQKETFSQSKQSRKEKKQPKTIKNELKRDLKLGSVIQNKETR